MLLRHVGRSMAQHHMTPGARVLVGVSGGVDSVVLLVVLQQLGYALVAAHVNYQLRGASSDGDEAFVRGLCEKRGIPVHVEAINAAAYAEEHGQSLQDAARDLRYRFFARVAKTEEVECVAVAHHLDDQVETVLLNLLRGAGPEGLAGMPAQRSLTPEGRVSLIRPLLDVRRAEIEAFARDEGLAWREDESNRSLTYKRNVLRAAVVPLLEEQFGDAAVANIARSASLVRAYVEETLRPELAAHFARAAQPEARRLDLHTLAPLAPVWRRRIILEALQRWWPDVPRHAALAEAIEALVEAQPGRRVELKGGSVWRERSSLLFLEADGAETTDRDEILVSPGETVVVEAGSLCVEMLEERPARLDAGAPAVVFVDADHLSFPLRVRRWRPGDRFHPLGMAGTKKVSDFLTDAKVPSHRRAGTWVLVSGEEIVWVLGLRLAHGVRVRSGTTRFAKITCIQGG